jgi:hypothetical protein
VSRLWFAKQRAKVLAPADAEAEKLLAKMQLGECALFEVQRPRSVAWHRMYFGICKTIGENQDPQGDASSIDAELRIRAGHFEVLLFDCVIAPKAHYKWSYADSCWRLCEGYSPAIYPLRLT